jgi:hypothetical protein
MRFSRNQIIGVIIVIAIILILGLLRMYWS